MVDFIVGILNSIGSGVGDDIVAALDLKTDRQNRKLLMQKWSWIGNGKKQAGRKELKRRIEE